jgi:outer membrane lipoprotein-sorting protein
LTEQTQSQTTKSVSKPVLPQGVRLSAALLVAAVSLTGVAAHSAAETLPVPKSAPKGRDGAQMSASETQRGNAAAPAQAAPNPVIPDPRRNAPASIFTTFDANQKAQAAKVSAILSSLQNLVGNFVQVGPDGSKVKGEFYIQKPGKVRFEYDPPSPIDIVADGSSVVVRDRKLATQDVYPLSQTPLRFLLSDRIDLLKETNVVGVSADDQFVTIVIEEKQPLIGTNRLMMMFGAKDLQLKQWVVTDPQGFDTTIAVSNLDSKSRPDPTMFKIDYTQYRN